MASEPTTPGRPSFKSVQPPSSHRTPEELFYKLQRTKTHGYLRGPQQDVLREYADLNSPEVKDLAFELPTGTGKTSVGLLLAEWTRLQGKRVAYLSLTNQLAGQVLAEAQRVGIQCADLRGKKEDRSPAEEGRFKTREAVGVTSYSNLFNVNPVVQDCDLLLFDDAHGGEAYVSGMWTVSVRSSDKALYDSLLGALRAGLFDSQVRKILDDHGFPTVEIVDLPGHQECVPAITAVLDGVVGPTKLRWQKIRNNLNACVALISATEITMRPLIPPTHTHSPFADAAQRIYMSATLGGEGDLRRAYGIQTLRVVRAKSTQWGRRYVFVPGLHVSEKGATALTGSAWDAMAARRAVLLTPSDRELNTAYESLLASMAITPTRFGAEDISESIETFVKSEDAILALAGRYDGLDLPDDQCRLLIMRGSPAATNPLERHLSERWKLGPVLRRRERTRLIQGMGRCTRNATDFAVIIWLGQALVNASTSSALIGGMPSDLAAEIAWGTKQSELAALNGGDEFINMISGLLGDASYRKDADDAISSIPQTHPKRDSEEYEQFGIDEVRFSEAMWGEDYKRALLAARGIVDTATTVELAGYRAWWWYLTSVAARLANSPSVEIDALRRGSKCGVNAGWLSRLLADRGESEAATEPESNAEAIWELFDAWGWAGPGFSYNINRMLQQLGQHKHATYHEGLEALGRCVGALTTRTTAQGAPDVVWSFPGDLHFAFEAKTEKDIDAEISKSDLQEAKGHPDWVRANLCQGRSDVAVSSIVVAKSSKVHPVGLPFTGGLFFLTPAEILTWTKGAASALSDMRITFSGRDYPSAAADLSAAIRAKRLDIGSVTAMLLSHPLAAK